MFTFYFILLKTATNFFFLNLPLGVSTWSHSLSLVLRGSVFFFLCLICLTELQEKETKTAQCCSFSSAGACNHIGYRQLLNVSYNILCCTYILFCLLTLHGNNNLDLHIISVLLSSLLDQALYQRSARLSAVRSLFKFFYSAK